MRFFVLWLDDEGFTNYAEHFEYPSLPEAQRFIARKFDRKHSIRPGIHGFFVAYADSSFIRRYTVAPGHTKLRRTEYCETELACENFPHLLKT